MAAGVELNIIDISGFPSDAFFAQQANVLSQDIDAVCASFNALNTWAQPIVSAGKKDKVLLTTIGSINEDFVRHSKMEPCPYWQQRILSGLVLQYP